MDCLVGLGRFLPCRLGVNHCRLRAAAAVLPLVAGLRGSGEFPCFRKFGEGGRKRIRLTKKTNVHKRFGVDPWGSQFPNDGRLTR